MNAIYRAAMGLLGAGALMSAGAGLHLLFAPSKPPRKIKSWKFEDKGNIVDLNPTSGQWTRIKEHQDSSLFNKCLRTTTLPTFSSETCYDYMETKASNGHPIRLFESEGKVSRNMKGWEIYRFTYGDGVETRYGVCMPIDIEGADNPCSSKNLPKGWTKSFVSKIPVDSR